MKQFVLFDLDGTLLDTAPDFTWCMNQLLTEYDKPLMENHLFKTAVATGTLTMMKMAFDIDDQSPDYEPLRTRFIDLYHQNIAAFTKPFDGIISLLEQLGKKHIVWGIVTNKPAWLTEALLKNMEFPVQPQVVVSGDTLPTRKPSPEPIFYACQQLGFKPEHGLFIGDTIIDIQAAKAANIPVLFAEYGYLGEHADIFEWAADGYIKHPLDILLWL